MPKKQKPMSIAEFFSKNNSDFMLFGELFLQKLTDAELINELAQKDLEKLAKVFKLVFELLAENTDGEAAEKLAELIEAYGALGKDGEQ